MSYSEPPKPRSPWFYIGIGCAAFLLIGMVGCSILGVALFNKAKEVGKEIAEEAKKPVTPQEIAKSFQDVPLYPGAKIQTDETARGVRVGIKVMKKTGVFKDADAAILKTPDKPEKVIAWYQKKMAAAGYQRIESTSRNSSENRTQLQYEKESTMVLVQVEESDGENETSVQIMKFEGVTKGFRYNPSN